MKMKRGRPRKEGRKITNCPKCNNIGYMKEPSVSYNSKFYTNKEDVPVNKYIKFRHEDRTIKDCYIDKLVKEQGDYLTLTPFKTIKQRIDLISKNLRKLRIASKTYPVTQDEIERFTSAKRLMEGPMNQLNCILWMVETEVSAITNGTELPKDMKEEFNEMHKLLGHLTTDRPELTKAAIDLQLQPMRQELTILDLKYGLPKRLIKKELWKQKLRDSYNYPKGTWSGLQ